MSDITYVCPFRKSVQQINDCPTGEYFMPCDFERCSLCEIFDIPTSKMFRCNYPNESKGWLIKSEEIK